MYQGLFLQEVYYFISLFQQLAKRDSLPKWALTSFPGSGVTWTRQMIEGITGIYTGSVHEQDPSPVQVEGTVCDSSADSNKEHGLMYETSIPA